MTRKDIPSYALESSIDYEISRSVDRILDLPCFKEIPKDDKDDVYASIYLEIRGIVMIAHYTPGEVLVEHP